MKEFVQKEALGMSLLTEARGKAQIQNDAVLTIIFGDSLQR